MIHNDTFHAVILPDALMIHNDTFHPVILTDAPMIHNDTFYAVILPDALTIHNDTFHAVILPDVPIIHNDTFHAVILPDDLTIHNDIFHAIILSYHLMIHNERHFPQSNIAKYYHEYSANEDIHSGQGRNFTLAKLFVGGNSSKTICQCALYNAIIVAFVPQKYIFPKDWSKCISHKNTYPYPRI